ncbi:RNA-binding protein, putative [Entamoeba invadens IP1]|uniref:RNA-binding protein, putative n=1 Tax=Entamoeba invadens IP1 TaxID=370355 RepID=A0A0A1U308_ENTIV|nr:RNA-binding protein, putative [Entamoeba invadens IP1]ELP88409.1 RNA-binding protein, putative [Entamoeba invadens IP1]|eukprot:XP_004255180.1 RNA-binding protein, putative [Entamoeba invadens IP1]
MQSPRFLSPDYPHRSSEHPSHTIFVAGVTSIVDPDSYTTLFSSFGELENLITSNASKGYIVATYYDIRSSRVAFKTLQKTIINGSLLDVHFTVARPTKQTNQGTVVVFNLDSLLTTDDVYSLFSQYGEIKEIRETPNKRHHRFIEFFDTRAAQKALTTLDKTEFNGKVLKIEFSRPGGKEISYVTEDLIEKFSSSERQRAQSDPGKCPMWGKTIESDSEIFISAGRGRAATSSKSKRKIAMSVEEGVECETPQENSFFTKTPEQILSDQITNEEEECCL